MSTPYWVQDAVFYQIFPDRFANGDPSLDPPNVEPWGSPPNFWGFQGGDLRGIIDRFDYLLDLGINAIYLNPIFQASSNHRYNTYDYFKIDPKLGDLHDFHSFLEVAHNNGVRVILDGVFNHCGRGFFAFNDVLENQDHSAYRQWFHLQHLPVDAYSPGEARDYLAWWGIKSLPKFNTDNPAVRRYILDVARFWVELGIDGWRLDVPNEIDDDNFWAEFRYTVKSANREAYLVGEIWTPDPRWVGPNHFDGLMNYPVRDALLDYLNGASLTFAEFVERIERVLTTYPRENIYAMYLPLGSHDTRRLYSKLGRNLDQVKLAFLFQFAYPGAPAIYYGDEIGLEGEKDPDCRRAFPWEQGQWNHELRSWVQNLISLRKRNLAMRRGAFLPIWVDTKRSCYAFARVLGDQKILVVLNASATRRYLRLPVGELDWPDGRILQSLLDQGEHIVSGDSLSISLQPWTGVWLA